MPIHLDVHMQLRFLHFPTLRSSSLKAFENFIYVVINRERVDH